jgi:hypothetical protein
VADLAALGDARHRAHRYMRIGGTLGLVGVATSVAVGHQLPTQLLLGTFFVLLLVMTTPAVVARRQLRSVLGFASFIAALGSIVIRLA